MYYVHILVTGINTKTHTCMFMYKRTITICRSIMVKELITICRSIMVKEMITIRRSVLVKELITCDDAMTLLILNSTR